MKVEKSNKERELGGSFGDKWHWHKMEGYGGIYQRLEFFFSCSPVVTGDFVYYGKL